MDFTDLQKSEFVSTVINKSGLQPGFNPNHSRFVDVPSALFLAGEFDVKLAQDPINDDRHPVFLRVGGVNQHLFAHL